MVAASAIVAQSLGANDKEKAKKVVGQVLTMNLFIGILFNALLYIFTPYIVTTMGSTGETAELAIEYVRIRSFEMIPVFMFYAFLASRQASGDTVTPVIFDIIAIFINIILTWLFVNKLGMGLSGAAFGTVIGNFAVLPVFLYLLFNDKKAAIRLDKKSLKLDFEETKKIFVLGIPSAVAQTFTSVGFLLINTLILSYGDEVMSGFGIGNNINSFVLMPALGVGGSIATFVGQNIGANNPKRAKDTVRCGMILTVGIMVIGGFSLMFLRGALAGIFSSPGDVDYEIAKTYMFFLFFSLPLVGIFQVFIGVFQGTGNTKFVFLVSSIRLWVLRIPVAYIFMKLYNSDSTGVMYAMIISNLGASFLGFAIYKTIKFDKKIYIENLEA